MVSRMLITMKNMRAKLIPLVLCTTGVALAFLAGCRKGEEEASASVPPTAPESYMNDPEFTARLKEQRSARLELMKSRTALVEEMKKVVEATKARLPGRSDAEVKAALEADVEWISLRKRVADLNAAMEENRLRTTKIVGDRIRPKDISK